MTSRQFDIEGRKYYVGTSSNLFNILALCSKDDFVQGHILCFLLELSPPAAKMTSKGCLELVGWPLNLADAGPLGNLFRLNADWFFAHTRLRKNQSAIGKVAMDHLRNQHVPLALEVHNAGVDTTLGSSTGSCRIMTAEAGNQPCNKIGNGKDCKSNYKPGLQLGNITHDGSCNIMPAASIRPCKKVGRKKQSLKKGKKKIAFFGDKECRAIFSLTMDSGAFQRVCGHENKTLESQRCRRHGHSFLPQGPQGYYETATTRTTTIDGKLHTLLSPSEFQEMEAAKTNIHLEEALYLKAGKGKVRDCQVMEEDPKPVGEPPSQGKSVVYGSQVLAQLASARPTELMDELDCKSNYKSGLQGAPNNQHKEQPACYQTSGRIQEPVSKSNVCEICSTKFLSSSPCPTCARACLSPYRKTRPQRGVINYKDSDSIVSSIAKMTKDSTYNPDDDINDEAAPGSDDDDIMTHRETRKAAPRKRERFASNRLIWKTGIWNGKILSKGKLLVQEEI